MIVISLSSNFAGPACAVATSIKKNLYSNKNYPTNFFDYLVISMKSINELLNLKENDINFLDKNLKITNNTTDKKTVEFLNFDKMISYHDLKENYIEEDFKNFIDKYKRRYYRLLNYIKNEKIIFFIRYNEENDVEIKNFYNIINNINPELNFYFINLIYKENSEELNNDNNDLNNYLSFNFYEINNKNITYDEDLFYKTLQFNWEKIFEIINNEYSKIKD